MVAFVSVVGGRPASSGKSAASSGKAAAATCGGAKAARGCGARAPSRSRGASQELAPTALAASAGGIVDDLGVAFGEIVPAETEFAKKFAKRRGADVRTVGETVRAFFTTYARPLPTVYSTVVNETLTTTHLSVVHYAFHYDALFAFGFVEAFDRFLQYFPSDTERNRLYDAMTSSLQLDGAKMRKDAAAVREWATAEGRSAADVLELAASGDSSTKLGAALATAKSLPRIEFHVSRMFALGCVFVLEAAKVSPDEERATLEKLATELDLSAFPLTDAMDQYRAGMERLKAAEQLFAEVAARDKRKNAERLAERAKEAEERAKQAEQEAAEPTRMGEPIETGAPVQAPLSE
mmetsp:Transcript_6589/g.17697  ORF Transcript_6589/g.17697 Transcript_6589/m.17697 type:complete len:351 (+) Transcript_6589:19-1071(+)